MDVGQVKCSWNDQDNLIKCDLMKFIFRDSRSCNP